MKVFILVKVGKTTIYWGRPRPRALADLEQMDYDPKECELCLRKTKPGETLVEVCCGANVQIARST
jgi:hypothetical protein